MTNENKCIIKSKEYQDSYYQGGASYSSDIKIFNYADIPGHLKNNTEDEIIFLDSKKGLEILIDKIHELQNYISTEEPILNKKKKELENLYSIPLIQKYVKGYNKIPSVIRNPDIETNKKIIESILKGKSEN